MANFQFGAGLKQFLLIKVVFEGVGYLVKILNGEYSRPQFLIFFYTYKKMKFAPNCIKIAHYKGVVHFTLLAESWGVAPRPHGWAETKNILRTSFFPKKVPLGQL